VSVRLKNLRTTGPLYVPLTSGHSARLSPQLSSQELPEIEVRDNPKIARLVDQGDLAIVHTGGRSARQTRSHDTAKPAAEVESKRKPK
jgi:hypothetical protein